MEQTPMTVAPAEPKQDSLPTRSSKSPEILERDDIIESIPPALVCGEHILMVGPPGTAKSMAARAACQSIEGGQYFEHLLTRFSGPEELFGPVMLSQLKQDKFARKIEGRLPTAHIAFIDEIFKANSAILNSLLSVLNERIYHNDSQTTECPLISCFAASNEFEEGEELAALRDRFTMTFEVENIHSEHAFIKMLDMDAGIPDLLDQKITVQQLMEQRNGLRDIKMDYAAIIEIRAKLASKSIKPSDRTWRKAVNLCKANALIEERDTVTDEDLGLLKHVLWRNPQDRPTVFKIIGQKANPALAKLQGIQEVNRAASALIQNAMREREAGKIDQAGLQKVITDQNRKIGGQKQLVVPLTKKGSPKVKRTATQVLDELESTLNIMGDIMSPEIGQTASKFFE